MSTLFKEAYATALLTMSLLPDREEYAQPYSPSEFAALKKRVRETEFFHVGHLFDVDVASLSIKLNVPVEEGYRIYMLLNRGIQFSHLYEQLMTRGVDIMTVCNAEYPARLNALPDEWRANVVYAAGNMELLQKPAVAILAISGVRTTPETKAELSVFVENAVRSGCAILSGGEPGIPRFVSETVAEKGGTLIEFTAGGLFDALERPEIVSLKSRNAALLLSAEHPSAPVTIPRAIHRNRMMFALADAAFIISTDGKRGEAECIANRVCASVYAWTECEACASLIQRGATPLYAPSKFDFDRQRSHWRRSEQISLLDLL